MTTTRKKVETVEVDRTDLVRQYLDPLSIPISELDNIVYDQSQDKLIFTLKSKVVT